jgi:hypothetical protein
MSNQTVPVHVLGLSDAGVRVVTFSSTAEAAAFWLPRTGQHATFVNTPEPGKSNAESSRAGSLPSTARSWVMLRKRAKDSERRVRSEYAKPLATPTRKDANTMATTKDNCGALFKNQRKDEGNSNAPDYSGDLLIEGTRYRLAGWIKESSRGKFLSLSVKRDEQQPAKPAANGIASRPWQSPVGLQPSLRDP